MTLLFYRNSHVYLPAIVGTPLKPIRRPGYGVIYRVYLPAIVGTPLKPYAPTALSAAKNGVYLPAIVGTPLKRPAETE